ncbi:uncharacterized protein LOC120539514 [Polypterus senegalus]|uniref:uncharacterized protein LOC120539514 n=1 Tax=Polypterus senegalus TaxID=55291 RepID=UPI0019649887|nr:uncharacterized protein LOC120539514 [Polypterus senegalus]
MDTNMSHSLYSNECKKALDMETSVSHTVPSKECKEEMDMETCVSHTVPSQECGEEMDMEKSVSNANSKECNEALDLKTRLSHTTDSKEFKKEEVIQLINRGCEESFFPEKHKPIKELRDVESLHHMRQFYFIRNPLLPKVKLNISKLLHATTSVGLTGILQKEGFKGELFNVNLKYGPFSFWTGAADPQDTQNQIDIWLQKNQKHLQTMPKETFNTSPAFSESSLYGNYKFTLEFADVLEAYKSQCCEGKDPVFRVFGTSCFKAEIMYTVIVHSPDENQFNNFPCLTNDDDSICTQDSNVVFWRPESMSSVNIFHQDGNPEYLRYFVWDHLVFAFHIKDYLKFPRQYLLEHLSGCSLHPVHVCRELNYSMDDVNRYVNHLKGEQEIKKEDSKENP